MACSNLCHRKQKCNVLIKYILTCERRCACVAYDDDAFALLPEKLRLSHISPRCKMHSPINSHLAARELVFKLCA